jgi:hypothetical protein
LRDERLTIGRKGQAAGKFLELMKQFAARLLDQVAMVISADYQELAIRGETHRVDVSRPIQRDRGFGKSHRAQQFGRGCIP